MNKSGATCATWLRRFNWKTMTREIQAENTTWKLNQAYAGLQELHSADKNAAQKDGLVWVVATPDGGAQSVRLHLPLDWESLKDDELLAEIAKHT